MKKIIMLSQVQYLYMIFSLILVSCQLKEQDVKQEKSNRYVLALTYSNNALNKLDSLEITASVCHTLIYLTKNNYCEMLLQNKNEIHFYKGYIQSHIADSIISIIEHINMDYKEVFNPNSSCLSDLNIIIETDSSSVYKFINNNDKAVFELIKDIEIKNKLKQTDTIENILKYKFYITNRVSYFLKSHYGFLPINRNMLQSEIYKPIELIPKSVE